MTAFSTVVPEVVGDGVLLSAWAASDVPAVLELARDEETQRWSASLRPVQTEDAARAWLASRTTDVGRYDWAVRDPGTRAMIGRVGLYRFDGHVAEVGYGVHPAHRRRGVAVRAVGAATDHAFTVLGLVRIGLVHAVGNDGSCAVARSAAFAYEGRLRAMLDHGDGVLHDAHLHARLATDPPVEPGRAGG